MQTEQIPGHLFGPPRPLIAFFYGDGYLGEVCGHPNDIQGAQTKLLQILAVVEPGDPTNKRGRILRATHVQVFCGDITVKLPYRDASSALWNTAECQRQIRRYGHIVH